MRMGILLLALALGTGGCATIVKGGRAELVVNSPTPDAEVSIKAFSGPEVYAGPAPAKVKVSKSDQYTVIVSAPGYKTQRQVVSKSVSGWMFGNLIWVIPILWGVGIAVDAMSGALWSLDPDEMTIRLVPAPAAAPPAPLPPTEAPSATGL